MKTAIIISAMILASLIGCEENKQSVDELITIDVTKSYPKKKLPLQDIFDIEYIQLDTNHIFTTMGYMQDISENMIIVRNLNRSSDGDIFILIEKAMDSERLIGKVQELKNIDFFACYS